MRVQAEVCVNVFNRTECQGDPIRANGGFSEGNLGDFRWDKVIASYLFTDCYRGFDTVN